MSHYIKRDKKKLMREKGFFRTSKTQEILRLWRCQKRRLAMHEANNLALLIVATNVTVFAVWLYVTVKKQGGIR